MTTDAKRAGLEGRLLFAESGWYRTWEMLSHLRDVEKFIQSSERAAWGELAEARKALGLCARCGQRGGQHMACARQVGTLLLGL